MKTKLSSIFIILLFTACDNMKTELDVSTISFPPKLTVSATLDGGNGDFTVVLTEGRSLADYTVPQPIRYELIRDGEIRLFEDDRLIFSERGTIDMSNRDAVRDSITYQIVVPYYHGHYFKKSGIPTTPGCVYRLEVEVDGYETVVASEVMPVLPVVSAAIDTTATVTFPTVSGWGYQFWPVSVQLDNAKQGNYYALEMICDWKLPDYPERDWLYYYGVAVADKSLLVDSPKDMFISNESEPYWTNILFLNNLSLTAKNGSLTCYAQPPDIHEVRTPEQDSSNLHVYTLHRFIYTFRINHISKETFKYYHSLAAQRLGVGFYTEPVLIFGNIKNGYGMFSVFNSLKVNLLEIEKNGYLYIGN